MSYNIAIDGPAGAGKSTIAKIVANRLSFIYVDTGAMYRTMTLFMIRNNVDITNGDELSQRCQDADISIKYIDGSQRIFLAGEDVTGLIRTEEIGNKTSVCSANPSVRNQLTAMQKKMAQREDVVMDGRDIGTVVLPKADLKIYLTASVEARAKRRYKELLEKGDTPDIDIIKADIEKRDYQDMNRETAPLRQADDAVLVDSSDMSIEEVVERICSLVKR